MPNDSPIIVLLAQDLPAEIHEEACALSPRLRFISATGQDDLALLEQAEIIYGHFSPDWLARAPRVRWVQFAAAGVERVLQAGAAPQAVFTNVHIHAEPIAEQLFGMLLMLVRRLHLAYRQQLEHQWALVGQPGVLSGMTLGVLGAGSIGRRTAELGVAFGMRVLGMRTQPGMLPPFAAMFTPEHTAEMFAQCDVVILTLPLTPRTVGFLGAREFAQMKQGTLLCNIGRGRLIETEALLAALHDGTLGGAALDVTDPEPLPHNHPLWDEPNVLITPHNAGLHCGYAEHAAAVFLDNLRRYLAGQPLENVVDKEAGY